MPSDWSASVLVESVPESGARESESSGGLVTFDQGAKGALFPIADIDEVAGDGSRGCHLWAHEVGSSTFALSSLEVAV